MTQSILTDGKPKMCVNILFRFSKEGLVFTLNDVDTKQADQNVCQ